MEDRISEWPTPSVLTVPSFPLITKLHFTCGEPSASYISKANFTKFHDPRLFQHVVILLYAASHRLVTAVLLGGPLLFSPTSISSRPPGPLFLPLKRKR